MKKQIIIFIIILFIIVFSFLFWKNSYSADDTILLSKAEKEIEHLEENIIEIMNSLNNITLSNSILVEEKTEKSNQNEQESENKQQSNNGSSNQEGENSENKQSSSSSNSSKSRNNEQSTSQNSTKYEIKNDSILTKEGQSIDWENIKSNIEAIHSTWATLTIDLHSLNVNSQDILNFSNTLDQVTISAKQEDKVATLNNLASLYAFFPSYINQISDDNKKINIEYTKASVLNSYAFVEQNKWEDMKAQLLNAINYFTNVLNTVNEDIENQNNMSKVYVLLNELNNSINIKDKDLYLIKYRNVMEELVNF